MTQASPHSYAMRRLDVNVGVIEKPAMPEQFWGQGQFQEHVLSVAQNEDDSVTLGQLTLNVRYDVSEHEGASAGVRVSTAERQLVGWLYQLDESGVANQFAGDHGFSGLVYLTHPTDGGDYQLICKAR